MLLQKVIFYCLFITLCLNSEKAIAQYNTTTYQQCALLNGVNDYMSYTSSTSIGNTNYTWQGWFRFSGNTTTTSSYMASATWGNQYAFAYMWLSGNSDASAMNGIICGYYSTANQYVDFNFSYIPPQNTWVHLASTWNNTTKTMSFYVNGVLWSTQTNATAASPWPPNGFICGKDPGNTWGYHNGYMDEVAFYNTTRTAAQIQADYNGVISASHPNLRLYYNFNQNNVRAGVAVPNKALATNAGGAGTMTTYGTVSTPIIATIGACSDVASSNNWGSSNMFTLGANNTNMVAIDKYANPDDDNLGFLSFIYRQNTAQYGGNSGMYHWSNSSNWGGAWNEFSFNVPSTTHLGRFPNCMFYNISQATNAYVNNNLFLNYLGSSINFGGIFNGYIGGAANYTSMSTAHTTANQSNTGNMVSLVEGAPGTFWAVNRFSNTVAAQYGIRIFKGTWNSAAKVIDWIMKDSITFNLTVPELSDPNIGFDPTGQIGYVTLLGEIAGGVTGGYKPIILKSSNAGNTWSAPIELNLNTLHYTNPCMENAVAALPSNGYIPSTSFEHDMVVDYLGNPHIFTSITQSSASNPYFVLFGLSNRMVDITVKNNLWTAVYISDQQAGRRVYGNMPNGLTMDMAPQASISPDGKTVGYSWADDLNVYASDPIMEPNLFVCVADLELNKRSARINVSGCGSQAGKIYFPHMSNLLRKRSNGVVQLFPVAGHFSTTANDPSSLSYMRFIKDVNVSPSQLNTCYIEPKYDTLTACGSYYWPMNGQTYTASGDYVSTTSACFTSTGCGTQRFLHLTVNANTSDTTTVNTCQPYHWAANGNTYSTSGVYTHTSTNTNGCTHTKYLILTINSATSTITSASACDVYTWAANYQTYTQSGTYIITTTNAAGCLHTDTLNVSINPCTYYLNVTAFIEGYYNYDMTMIPVLHGLGLSSNINDVDSVTIELHASTAPYGLIETFTGKLNKDGNIQCSFPLYVQSGSYYIVFKHRSSIETWSATPVNFSLNNNFDFSDGNNAYGANQKEVESGVFAIYSGDINQDNNVDLIDYNMQETAIFNFLSGYVTPDINGDGNVNLLDATILSTNSSNFIFCNRP